MRKLFMLLLLVATAQIVPAQTTAKKTAVICFGNSAYQNDPNAKVSDKFEPLPFAVNDAIKVENLFQRLKVANTIYPFLNSDTRSSILTSIKSAQEILSKDSIDQIVLYYSGHGIEEQYRNFIIPTHFKLQPLASKILPRSSAFIQAYITNMQRLANNSVESDFISNFNYYNLIKNAVALSEVANSFKNYQMLLISDACRSNLSQPNKSDNFNTAKYNFTEADIREKYKGIYKKKLSKKRTIQYLNELELYKREMEKTIAQFEADYRKFESTITEKLVRKPLTILFATSSSTKAGEGWIEKGGLFTASFLTAAQSDKVSKITFNEAFLETIKNSMLSKKSDIVQTPILVGSQNFTIPNPLYKKQITLDEYKKMVGNSMMEYNSISNLATKKEIKRIFYTSNPAKIYDPFLKDSLEYLSYKNDTLSIGRFWFVNDSNMIKSSSGNYQIESTLSFSTLNDNGDQSFFWDGYSSGNNWYGYRIAPYKVGEDFYMGFAHWDFTGYNQNPNYTNLLQYRLPSTDSLTSKMYAKNNIPLKFTIRRYNDEFFFFIDEKFIGRNADRVNKKHGSTILYNSVNLAIDSTDTTLFKPHLNQLNHGNIMTMTPVVIKEIKENMDGFNIEISSNSNKKLN